MSAASRSLLKRQPQGDRVEAPAPVPLVAVAPAAIGVGLGLASPSSSGISAIGVMNSSEPWTDERTPAAPATSRRRRPWQSRCRSGPAARSSSPAGPVRCLKLGQHRHVAGLARGGDPPSRPAPAADRRVAEEDQRRLFRVAQAIAVAEEDVFRQRADRRRLAATDRRQPAQLVERVGHDHGAVQPGNVAQTVRSGERTPW